MSKAENNPPNVTKPASGFRAASATWAAMYTDKYGFPYPWRGRCNKDLSNILGALTKPTEFNAIASAFLADTWAGYDGHELRHLWRDLTKFRARVARIASSLGLPSNAPKAQAADGWIAREPTPEEIALIREP